MPMLSWRSLTSRPTTSPSSAGAELVAERGRRVDELLVELQALAVGVQRALHEATGAAGDQPGLDLEARRLRRDVEVGERRLERDPVAGLDGRLVLVVHHHARAQHDDHRQGGGATAAYRPGVGELVPPLPADQQHQGRRGEPAESAEQGAVDGEVGDRGPDLGDLALGLAGDEGVALDELLVAVELGGPEVDVGAEPLAGGQPEARQVGPEVEGGVAVQGGPQVGVVAGEDGAARAGQEQQRPPAAAPAAARRGSARTGAGGSVDEDETDAAGASDEDRRATDTDRGVVPVAQLRNDGGVGRAPRSDGTCGVFDRFQVVPKRRKPLGALSTRPGVPVPIFPVLQKRAVQTPAVAFCGRVREQWPTLVVRRETVEPLGPRTRGKQ